MTAKILEVGNENGQQKSKVSDTKGVRKEWIPFLPLAPQHHFMVSWPLRLTSLVLIWRALVMTGRHHR